MEEDGHIPPSDKGHVWDAACTHHNAEKKDEKQRNEMKKKGEEKGEKEEHGIKPTQVFMRNNCHFSFAIGMTTQCESEVVRGHSSCATPSSCVLFMVCSSRPLQVFHTIRP